MTLSSPIVVPKDAILSTLIDILTDITIDWDFTFSDSIGESTKLVADLGFESIDIVQFVVAIEEHYKCRNIPFEEFLMRNGIYVDEISVNDAVNFLHRHLTVPSNFNKQRVMK